MNIDMIKLTNSRAGQHFFSANTMNFFRSAIESEVYNNRYFITSERGPVLGSKRRYTIREAINGGESIRTVGEFQAFQTFNAAYKALTCLIDTSPTKEGE